MQALRIICGICIIAGSLGCNEETPGTAPDATTDLGLDIAITPDDAISDVVPMDTSTGPTHGCNPLTLLDTELEVVSGSSEPIAFTVPENTVSVLVTVEGDPENQLVLGSWTSTSQMLVPPGWGADPENQAGLCLTCANRVTPSPGVTSAIAPNGPSALLEPGAHELTVRAFRLEGGFGGFGATPVDADDTVRVTISAKVREEAPSTGVLNLNLHFTGAAGWTAENAPTDPTLQDVLAKVDAIYATVGIKLGTITYHDIDPAFRTISDIDGPDGDLMTMFALSSFDDRPALNVFFVEKLIGPFGENLGVLLGIAGSIPGPGLVPGTVRGGVAIGTEIPAEVSATIATTMAHEMGHFLGLYHIKEEDLGGFLPTMTDPLPDTPEDPDDTWLMHKQGSGSKLSDWQGRIMRSNPLVCHPLDTAR